MYFSGSPNPRAFREGGCLTARPTHHEVVAAGIDV